VLRVERREGQLGERDEARAVGRGLPDGLQAAMHVVIAVGRRMLLNKG
jgi:hypothetical protein